MAIPGNTGSLSGTSHDSADPEQFDGIRGADSYAPAAADTAAVIRSKHPAMLLRYAMLPAVPGTGPASLAEEIVNDRPISTKTAGTGIIGFYKQGFPYR